MDAKEAAKEAVMRSGSKLADDYGLIIVLLVMIIVVIAAAGWVVWSMILWFQRTLKEQRTEFTEALTQQRETFTTALEKQVAAHVAEMTTHHAQVKEWRAEQVTESRATRELIQQCLNRLSEIRLEDEQQQQGGGAGRRRRGGT